MVLWVNAVKARPRISNNWYICITASKASQVFFLLPFASPCIHEPVTSAPLQSIALYLVAHTPAVPHYSVNALAELNLSLPSLPQMVYLFMLAKEVGR